MSATDAIALATARFPGISANGLAHPRTTRAPILVSEVETALKFLAMLTPTRAATYSSYFLKHCCENFGRRHGLARYVSNGALICAAAFLGYTIKPFGPAWSDNPNAGIGVSRRDLRRIVDADHQDETRNVARDSATKTKERNLE
jgi:hypothetical protein